MSPGLFDTGRGLQDGKLHLWIGRATQLPIGRENTHDEEKHMMTLKELQSAEAHRRLRMLGPTVKDPKSTLLGVRARQVGVPTTVLRQWHSCYLRSGLDGLIPTEWSELPEPIWALIEHLYRLLGISVPNRNALTMSSPQTFPLAAQNRQGFLQCSFPSHFRTDIPSSQHRRVRRHLGPVGDPAQVGSCCERSGE